MRILQPYWTRGTFPADLFDQVDHFLDGLNSTSALPKVYDERSFDPACEVSESDEHFLVSVDLPGVKKEDLKIEVANQVLTVSGERRRMETSENAKLQRFERNYGFFKRSFSLPTSVDAEGVEARYEDGVLELYIPKAQAAKPRQIEIQTGKSGIFDKLLGTKKNSSDSKPQKVS